MRIKLLLGLCLLTANASAQAQGTLFKMAPDALKSKVIIFEAGKGWNLISETASQIVLARPMSGLGGFLT